MMLLLLFGVFLPIFSRISQTQIMFRFPEFSPDPFSFGGGNEDKGNLVYLRTEFNTIECDVLPYYSNKEKIVCDTR